MSSSPQSTTSPGNGSPNEASTPVLSKTQMKKAKLREKLAAQAAAASPQANGDNTSAPVASITPSATTPVVLSLAAQAAKLSANSQSAAATATTKPTKPVHSTPPPAVTPANGSPVAVASAPSSARGVRVSSSSFPLVSPFDPTRTLVTSSLTASAAMVDTYVAWIRDAYAKGGRVQKAYVLELGAGQNQGRNAFSFLVHLSQRAAEIGSLAGIRVERPAKHATNSPLVLLTPLASLFTYILSDPSQSSLEELKLHPQLVPFFDIGILDIAVFDPTAPIANVLGNAASKGAAKNQPSPKAQMELYLQNTSTLLASLDAQTPLLVLENEQMSTAASVSSTPGTKKTALVSGKWKFDAFHFDSNTSILSEWLVSSKENDKGAPTQVEWTTGPIRLDSVYPPEQQAANRVLSKYVNKLRGLAPPTDATSYPVHIDTMYPRPTPKSSNASASSSSSTTAAPFHTFTLPITAFSLLQHLREFARGPVLTFFAERAFNDQVSFINQKPSLGYAMLNGKPKATAVVPNFHALSLFVKELGGFELSQKSRSVYHVKLSVFGFPSVGGEVASTVESGSSVPQPLPLPNKTTTPVKSALKNPTTPTTSPVVASETPADATVTATENDASASGKKSKVQFAGLSWHEKRAQKKADKAAAAASVSPVSSSLATSSSTPVTGARLVPRKFMDPPVNLAAAFETQWEQHSPFDLQGLISSAEPSCLGVGPSFVAQSIRLLSLVHYEVDIWARLKVAFQLPQHQAKKILVTPMEHDIFLTLQRVWQTWFALPSDIYGVLPNNANVDLAFELGAWYEIRRRYRAAIGFYQRSLQLFGHHAVTYYNIAQCYQKLHCYRQARANLQETLNCDGNFPQAQHWLEWVQTQVGTAEDESLSNDAEQRALEVAFAYPFGEPLGAVDESAESETNDQPIPSIQEEAAAILAKANGGKSTNEVKKPTGKTFPATPIATSDPVPTVDPKVTNSKANVKSAVMDKKLLARAAEMERTAARKAEALAQAHATGAIKQHVPPVAVKSSPSSSPAPSPSASPSLQSYLKPSVNESWAEMEDDHDTARQQPVASHVRPPKTFKPTAPAAAAQTKPVTQSPPANGPTQNGNHATKSKHVTSPNGHQANGITSQKQTRT